MKGTGNVKQQAYHLPVFHGAASASEIVLTKHPSLKEAPNMKSW